MRRTRRILRLVAGVLASAVLVGAPEPRWQVLSVRPLASPRSSRRALTGTCVHRDRGDRIGRITPAARSGSSRPERSGPLAITAGSDGNLWFTYIGKCDEVCVNSAGLGVSPPRVWSRSFRGASAPTAARGASPRVRTATFGSRRARAASAGSIRLESSPSFSKGLSRDFAPVEIAARCGRESVVCSVRGSEFPRTARTDYHGGGDHRVRGRLRRRGLAAGPDGNMWLAQSFGGAHRSDHSDGVITHFFKGISRDGDLSVSPRARMGASGSPRGRATASGGSPQRVRSPSSPSDPRSNPLKIATVPTATCGSRRSGANRDRADTHRRVSSASSHRPRGSSGLSTRYAGADREPSLPVGGGVCESRDPRAVA